MFPYNSRFIWTKNVLKKLDFNYDSQKLSLGFTSSPWFIWNKVIQSRPSLDALYMDQGRTAKIIIYILLHELNKLYLTPAQDHGACVVQRKRAFF